MLDAKLLFYLVSPRKFNTSIETDSTCQTEYDNQYRLTKHLLRIFFSDVCKQAEMA